MLMFITSAMLCWIKRYWNEEKDPLFRRKETYLFTKNRFRTMSICICFRRAAHASKMNFKYVLLSHCNKMTQLNYFSVW